jgi:hypothetical protein
MALNQRAAGHHGEGRVTMITKDTAPKLRKETGKHNG